MKRNTFLKYADKYKFIWIKLFYFIKTLYTYHKIKNLTINYNSSKTDKKNKKFKKSKNKSK